MNWLRWLPAARLAFDFVVQRPARQRARYRLLALGFGLGGGLFALLALHQTLTQWQGPVLANLCFAGGLGLVAAALWWWHPAPTNALLRPQLRTLYRQNAGQIVLGVALTALVVGFLSGKKS